MGRMPVVPGVLLGSRQEDELVLGFFFFFFLSSSVEITEITSGKILNVEFLLGLRI